MLMLNKIDERKVYVDETLKLHISLDELRQREYILKNLLSDDVEAIGRQVVHQFNIESDSLYSFAKVFGLLEGELVIQVMNNDFQ